MASASEHDADLETFFKVFKSLFDDGGCDRLQNALGSIPSLKEELREEKIANRVNGRKLTETEKELEGEKEKFTQKDAELSQVKTEKTDVESKLAAAKGELEETAKETTKLQTELKSRESEIEGLKKTLEEEKSHTSSAKTEASDTKKDLDSANQELKSAKEELEKKEKQLADLEKLACKLEALPAKDIKQRLDGMFKAARDLVDSYFNADLERTVLDDSDRWTSLKKSKQSIPLPLSNTTAAKQMRVAAVLTILASELAKNIFQPTYLATEGEELSELMTDLAGPEPQRERYLRSVLLAADPESQQETARTRVSRVVREVTGCVGPLLPIEKQGGFQSALEKLCRQVCEQWTRLQRIPEKIEPYLDLEESMSWQTRLLPFEGGAAPPPEGKEVLTNGNGAASSSKQPARGSPDPDNVVGVVWPCFLAVRDGEPKLLASAVVVSSAQASDAREEAGSRRASRSLNRRRTMSRAANGAEGSSRKPFLDDGDGNGPEGG
ncbi:hypothetical protein NKR23_g2569 [Pleurostoma richardsiae]|uniref:Uncharacterized protein n=1 Tax=Pleurostoma richardsiae TaxID=41990 RepID=A0AA38RQG8_9PEZI|nr:hypothetical protein NKR23_g2569 [Pleurostoma richardsiae]